jgi:hypothetical protein
MGLFHISVIEVIKLENISVTTWNYYTDITAKYIKL